MAGMKAKLTNTASLPHSGAPAQAGDKENERLIRQGKFHPVHCASWESSEKACPGQSEAGMSTGQLTCHLKVETDQLTCSTANGRAWQKMQLSHLQVCVRNAKERRAINHVSSICWESTTGQELTTSLGYRDLTWTKSQNFTTEHSSGYSELRTLTPEVGRIPCKSQTRRGSVGNMEGLC